MLKQKNRKYLFPIFITTYIIVCVSLILYFTANNSTSSENDAVVYNEQFVSCPKLNINTASAYELTALDFIGEKLANAIVEYRSSHGNFQSIEDIKNVYGIGDGIYESIKNRIYVESKADDEN